MGSNLQVPCFKRRLENCRAVLCGKREDIPKCIRSVVTLLLQTENITGVQTSTGIRTYPVTEFGIPPPSAHQLLLSNLSSYLLPLPSSFAYLYSSMKTFQDFVSLEEELKFVRNKSSATGSFDEAVQLIAKRINENKIIDLAKRLQVLDGMEKYAILMSPKWMDFILPIVLNLLQDRKTDVTAAWYLLELCARYVR